MSKLSKNSRFSQKICNSAISVAEKQIKAAQNRMKDLNKAAAHFQKMREKTVR